MNTPKDEIEKAKRNNPRLAQLLSYSQELLANRNRVAMARYRPWLNPVGRGGGFETTSYKIIRNSAGGYTLYDSKNKTVAHNSTDVEPLVSTVLGSNMSLSFGPGTFNWGTALTATSISNFSIKGAGYGSTQIVNNTNGIMPLTLKTCSNFDVHDLYLNGNNNGGSLYLDSCTYADVHDLLVTGFHNTGIYVTNKTHGSVMPNYHVFSNIIGYPGNSTQGFWVMGMHDSGTDLPSNIALVNCNWYTGGDGLFGEGINNVAVGCNFFGFDFGILFENTGAGTGATGAIMGWLVANCFISGGECAVASQNSATDNYIIGNMLQSSGSNFTTSIFGAAAGDSPRHFFINNISSPAPAVLTLSQAGGMATFKGNIGIQPVGVISNPFGGTASAPWGVGGANKINVVGAGGASTPTSTQTYTVYGYPVDITITAGTGQTITTKDATGATIDNAQGTISHRVLFPGGQITVNYTALGTVTVVQATVGLNGSTATAQTGVNYVAHGVPVKMLGGSGLTYTTYDGTTNTGGNTIESSASGNPAYYLEPESSGQLGGGGQIISFSAITTSPTVLGG